MSFFTTLSTTLLAPAEDAVANDGTAMLELKTMCNASKPGIPVILMVRKDTDNAKFLQELAKLPQEGNLPRVLVSGVVQFVAAEVDKQTKEVVKKPKIVVVVGSARRLRADVKIEPEQAVVFGSGFASPQTVYGSDQRKAELSITSGNESVREEGKWASRLTVLGDQAVGTEEICLSIDENRELFFMGNLFRQAGEVNGTHFDKLKVNLSFAQESDRVKAKGGSGRRPKATSMTSQLGAAFEEDTSAATTLSRESLAAQVQESLADF